MGENMKDLKQYGMSWNFKNWLFYIMTFFLLYLRKTHHESLNKFLKESFESL